MDSMAFVRNIVFDNFYSFINNKNNRINNPEQIKKHLKTLTSDELEKILKNINDDFEKFNNAEDVDEKSFFCEGDIIFNETRNMWGKFYEEISCVTDPHTCKEETDYIVDDLFTDRSYSWNINNKITKRIDKNIKFNFEK